MPNLRCPRNGTADEVARAASALARMPLRTRVFGKVARAAPSARIPANGGGARVSAAERLRDRGELGAGLSPLERSWSHRRSPVLRAAGSACAPLRLPSASLVFCRSLAARRRRRRSRFGLRAGRRHRQPRADAARPASSAMSSSSMPSASAHRAPTPIEDLLRREGGIQLSRNGGPGQSASVLLRGVAASGMLVLVDGVRIGSATLGQVDFAGIGLVADRAHRDPARPRVEPLRCRCGRRRRSRSSRDAAAAPAHLSRVRPRLANSTRVPSDGSRGRRARCASTTPSA